MAARKGHLRKPWDQRAQERPECSPLGAAVTSLSRGTSAAGAPGEEKDEGPRGRSSYKREIAAQEEKGPFLW